MSSSIIYLLYFVTVFFLSFLLHNFFYNRSKKYVIRKANVNAERWSSQTKPVSGGMTFFMSFIISMVFYFLMPDFNHTDDSPLIGIFIVLTLSFLMGLADDMINSSPYFKFFVQLLNSIILINFNLYIHIFENETYNYILTVLWVVGIMNSINMLDNMDAITSSVSLVIFLFSILASLLLIPDLSPIFIIILIGAFASVLSFLFYNWSPAKMYMGDNGSQFIGALLSIIGIVVFWNYFDTHPVPVTRNFVIIGLVFLFPICDTATVTINRIARGKSPFTGGKDHTTHHLSYMGLKDRQVALVFLVGTVFSTALAFIVMKYFSEWYHIHFIIFTAICLGVFITLFSITKKYKQKK